MGAASHVVTMRVDVSRIGARDAPSVKQGVRADMSPAAECAECCSLFVAPDCTKYIKHGSFRKTERGKEDRVAILLTSREMKARACVMPNHTGKKR